MALQTIGHARKDPSFTALIGSMEDAVRMTRPENLVAPNRWSKDEPIRYQGVYIVPNRLVGRLDEVMAPGAWVPTPEGLITDARITARRSFYLDLDTQRRDREGKAVDLPISATKEELHRTIARSIEIEAAIAQGLRSIGVERAADVIARLMSGNGMQLWFALDDIPETQTVRDTIKDILLVWEVLFDGDESHVDTSVFDAKRIGPLAGTIKRKGNKSHRLVTFAGATHPRALTLDELKALLAHFKERLTEAQRQKLAGATGRSRPKATTASSTGASSDGLAAANGVSVREVAAKLGIDTGRPLCPWCGSGGGSDVAFLDALGANLLNCMHNRCSKRPNRTPVDLVAKAAFGVDDIKGSSGTVVKVLDWFEEHFDLKRSGKNARPKPPSKEERAATMKTVMAKIGPVNVADAVTAANATEGAGGNALDGAEAKEQRVEIGHLEDGKSAASSTSPPVAQNDTDIDEVLRPALGLDAIQRDRVLRALHKTHGLSMGALRARLAEIETEVAPEQETSNPTAALNEVLTNVTFVQATNCRVFALMTDEVIPADSPRLKAKVAYLYQQHTGATIGATAIETALAPMFGADIPHGVVPVRCAYDKDGSIWVDLASEARGYAHVTSTGVTVEASCPVRFHRPQTVAPMPVPVIPQNEVECRKVFDDVQAHFQLTREQLAGAFIWAVGAVRPGEPYGGGKLTEYTVLLVNGPPGSGKTTFADSWSEAVDPKVTPHFKLPRDDEGLAILAENTRSLVFNNLSHIPQWTSDALCELADGSGMVLRSLYTARDTTVFKGSSAVALVSVGDVAVAPDLLDRSLMISLPERLDYVEPEQVEARFQQLRPRLLGALLFCASRGLRDSGATKAPRGVRMAGAARWALAAGPAGGFNSEEIETAFAGAIEEADQQVLDHPIVVALQHVVTTDSPWEGTTKDLLAALTAAHEAKVPETGTPTKKVPKDWPETAQALRSALRMLAKTLTRSGFTFVWPTGAGRGGRVLTIMRVVGGPEDMPHPGMGVEDVGDPNPGTIPGTIGTMPLPESAHRSLDKNRVGNDGNDGNDGFLLLEEEKKKKTERETESLLSKTHLEDVQSIVPIVPIVPTSEKQAGTMRASEASASFRHRSTDEPMLQARAVWGSFDGVQLTIALLAQGEPDDAEPTMFEFSGSLDGAQNMLGNYGWSGGHNERGLLVGFAHEVLVTTQPHTFHDGEMGLIVTMAMRIPEPTTAAG
jgi:hypothetical protein